MKGLILEFLNITAIRMEVQPVFGAFHITASLTCIILAAVLSIAIAQRLSTYTCLLDASDHADLSYSDFILTHDVLSNSESTLTYTVPGTAVSVTDLNDQGQALIIHILSGCGWLLLITEIWKQLFICYIMNSGVYDFWFLPFQLCSVPMYLCILLPNVSAGLRRTFLSFMASYTFISAICTFIYPADLLRPYLLLTLHGFIWHGILMFISLLVIFSGLADLSLAGFGRATILFLLLSTAAIILNIIAEPFAASAHALGAAHSYPNMFYMNPYHISTQPLIGSVQNILGIPAGISVYIAAIIILSGILRKFMLEK